MKKTLTTVTFLLLAFSGYTQNLPDISAIHSLSALKNTKEQLVKDKKDNFHTSHYTLLDSALWQGILVQDVALYEQRIEMKITKGVLNGSRKAARFLQSTYKDEVTEEGSWFSRSYLVNTNAVSINLEMDIEKDDSVKSNTPSKITITYKPVYQEAYPNISAKLVKDPDGIFYFLDMTYYNNNMEVWLDGISIYNNVGKHRYMNERSINLNPFLLGKDNVNLKVLITPGMDEEGKPFSTIQKRSYAAATLKKGIFKNGDFTILEEKPFCNYNEYVTDTIKENGDTRYSSYPGTYHYGGKQLESNYSFIAGIGYTNKGWKDGNDLRNDKRLKEKVSALYEKLAHIINTKDAAALSQLFYEKGMELAVAGYNQDAGTPNDQWTRWMDMLDYTNIVKVETEFDLELSADGKLAYAKPRVQADMLRAVGKGKAEGFSLFMYEDKNTNELKFIR